MADNRKITIEILSSEGDSSQTKEQKPENDVKKALNKIMHPLKNSSLSDKASFVVVVYALEQARKMLVQGADYMFGRYYSLTEDYIGQTNYQNIKTAYGKVTGGVSSIFGGALVGSLAGPVGAVAGAVIGAFSWGVGEHTQNQSILSNYYQDLNSTNLNTQYNRTRAGLINEGRGTEN